MDVLSIPGLREAIARETEARELDFLGAPELLCGIEVMPLSIRRLLRLQAVQSPFLYSTVGQSCRSAADGEAAASPYLESPADVALFFWSISPNYERALQIRHWCELFSPALGQWVFNRIRKTFLGRLRSLKLGAASAACRDLVTVAFEDAPGGSDVNPSVSYYGWPAGYVGLLATEYGWSEDEILDLPLRRLWQHVRRLILKDNPNAILFNPSNKVRGRWLAEINRKQHAARVLQRLNRMRARRESNN